MDRPLVFIHIQKTAGSAVGLVLADLMPGGLVFEGSATLHTFESTGHKLAAHGKRPNAAWGHLPYAHAIAWLAPAHFVTILRNPVDRMLSDFCSQGPHKALPDFGLSRLESALHDTKGAEWAHDNLQVRMLCNDPRWGQPCTWQMLWEARRNLERFTLVGVHDKLDDFTARLGALLDRPPVILPPSMVTGPYRHLVTDDHRAIVREYNLFDLDLWRHVTSRSLSHAPAPERHTARPGH